MVIKKNLVWFNILEKHIRVSCVWCMCTIFLHSWYMQPLFHINTCVMSSAVDSIATEIFLWSGDAFSKLLIIAPDVFTDIGQRVKAQTYAKQLLYSWFLMPLGQYQVDYESHWIDTFRKWHLEIEPSNGFQQLAFICTMKWCCYPFFKSWYQTKHELKWVTKWFGRPLFNLFASLMLAFIALEFFCIMHMFIPLFWFCITVEQHYSHCFVLNSG